MEFSLDEYFTKDEIREMIRDSTSDYIRNATYGYFNSLNPSDIVANAAKDIVVELFEEYNIDYKEELRNKVLELINELKSYQLFGDNYRNGRYEKAKAQILLEECIEEVKPEMKEKVKELYLEKIGKTDAANVLTDCFYSIVSDVFDK